MDLTTRCPQCGTIFSASLEQLQLRKGYIRCISCAHIFDGFEAVVSADGQSVSSKDTGRPLPSSAAVVTSGSPASVDSPTNSSVGAWPANPDIQPADARVVPNVVRQRSRPEPAAPSLVATSVAADPAFTISSSAGMAREAREDDRRFHLGDAPAGSARPEPVISPSRETTQPIGRRTEPHAAWSVNSPSTPRVSSRAEPHIEEPRIAEPRKENAHVRDTHVSAALPQGLYAEPRESEQALEPDDNPDSYQRSGRISTYFWRIAVALGLVVLLCQFAYVYRMQIANDVPFLRPVMEKACVSLDCQVPYSRNIGGISILSSSLSSGYGTNIGTAGSAQANGGKSKPAPAPSDALVLQLIMRNTYDKPQEWPTLVLSLKDASGALVVRKNLPPDTYLPETARSHPFAAGGEIAVRVPILLNGQKINGYQLDKYFQ